MADLSHITAYLAAQTAAAVYPNGTGQPSVANIDCIINEGWPLPDQIDLDMSGMMMNTATPPAKVKRPGGKRANISIFPMLGTGVTVYQLQDKTYTITPAAINLAVVTAGQVITVTNQPAVGEYITLVIDDVAVCSQGGATTQILLAALAAQAISFGYAATSTATTLTIPFGHTLVVRQGGIAVLGKVINRQRQAVMITVWAPTQVVRASLAMAIDNLLKQSIVVTMPDTSQAKITYSRTNVLDEQQVATVYRRDLIFDVEYATVEEFPGYVITSTNVSIANPSNTAIAHAIT